MEPRQGSGRRASAAIHFLYDDITRRRAMVTWEMATILVLAAYILGLMTAIRLLRS